MVPRHWGFGGFELFLRVAKHDPPAYCGSNDQSQNRTFHHRLRDFRALRWSIAISPLRRNIVHLKCAKIQEQAGFGLLPQDRCL
jgi:hypothetical protein